MMKRVLIRTTTIPGSMKGLLAGQLRFMSDYYDVIAITSGGAKYEEMLKEQGVRGYVVPFSRRTFSPIMDIKAFFALIRIFRKEKPYIVHSHTSKDGLLCMVAAWICGVPNRLYTIAGLADMSGIRGLMLDLAEWVTFACATKIYPNSRNMMSIYFERGMLKKSKTKVLLNGSSNGIDVDHFSRQAVSEEKVATIKNQYGLTNNIFTYIYIGRVTGDKGVNELIRAFSQLSREYESVRLLMLGNFEKDLDDVSKQTSLEIDSNPYIIFTGFQSDVRPFILASDVLVLPSYREGMPNVVMQAGALDTACIVTNINGSNEIIIDGINGSIVPRKNASALYEKMKYFYLHQDEVQTIGKNARELIISRYRRQELWQALLEEYQSLEK